MQLTKRNKYIIQSAAIIITLYLFSRGLPEISGVLVALLVLIVFAGSYLVHLPNSKPLNILVTSILPSTLVAGYCLSIIYFPNLSLLFKMVSLVVFGILFYLILLVNNVFLVVETRQEAIPLYRVALTWSKILIAAVSIPLLAGFYKISTNSFIETFLTFSISILYIGYLIWVSKLNPDTKKYKIGEIITMLAFGSFLVTVANIAVSFLPTETFLRAIFVSSILIFAISFIEAHFKNAITKKLISEHIAISIIFIIILLIFKP